MKLHLGTFIGMIIVIFGASIVGRVVQVLSVRNSSPVEVDRPTSSDKINDDFAKDETIFSSAIDNSSEHLIWFLQISDLHLSLFHDSSRITSLEKFANETVDVIKPSVVLASGDLTDAKIVDSLGSKQFRKEWIYYNEILTKARVNEKTVWLDIRGNHDNFDVPSLSSSNNFYQRYSMQGPKHQRSYMYTLKKGYDTVAFIAVDACLLPGPRRPFNFIGVLTSKEMEVLEAFELESRKHNHTVWFGHYPTSCIISPNSGIRKLMGGRSLAYLCGHLHTLRGFVNNMYTRQHTGSLELELGDWKDERIFRVAAIDHGLFSFIDVPLGQWPIVLLTNPKEALFNMPEKEPLRLVAKSSHIRALVWSLSPLSQVKVRIDRKGKWHLMSHVEGPLFVAQWTPKKYLKDVHTIEVYAEDAKGRKNLLTQSFCLDDSDIDFSLWARVVLMSNVSAVFQFLFGVSTFLCVVPLCLIRWIHYRVKDKKMPRPRVRLWIAKIWLRKMWTLSCVDKLFWPLVLYAVYLPIGPWFIGEVMEGHIGVVFAWGTFVYDSLLPGSLTYAYGFIQIIVFQLPLILITAHSADMRFQILFENHTESLLQYVWRHVSYFSLILMQGMNAYYFYLSYGTMALILGPLRTWATILGLLMWYQSSKLTEKDFRVMAKIWASHSSVVEMDFGLGGPPVSPQHSHSGSKEASEPTDTTSLKKGKLGNIKDLGEGVDSKFTSPASTKTF